MNSDSEVVDDPRLINKHASLVILCKDIGDTLNTTYPGWMWAIAIYDEHHGAISIKNLMLSNKYGYVVHTDTVLNHRDVVRAGIMGGGEILERFGQPRGRRLDDWEARSTWGPDEEAIPLERPKKRVIL